MFDLNEWRKKWEAMNREDIRLLQKMTIEESVTIYLSLCHSMAPFIDATGDLYLPERKSHLTELQERLRKFGEWKRQQNGHRAEPA